MRLAIATPGNDFRLGACEAPPAIISVYLGTDMTNYLDAYRKGHNEPYAPSIKTVSFGASAVPPIQVPAEDRNRTSPFPYGGHRFEFRAVGSSQNVSLVNTVLSSISAKAFKEFADAIEGGQSAKEVAKAALNEHWKVIFNGNGYDPANQQMLTDNGLWRIDSGVEAITCYSKPKNMALFEELGVLTAEECKARQTVLLNHYIGTVEIEAGAMVEMLNGHIIPSVKAAGVGPLSELQAAVTTIREALADIHHTGDTVAKATKARTLRLETMIAIREVTDAAEDVVPAALWTLPTYKDLLFLDQTTK
jgi:glutamine synthetase